MIARDAQKERRKLEPSFRCIQPNFSVVPIAVSVDDKPALHNSCVLQLPTLATESVSQVGKNEGKGERGKDVPATIGGQLGNCPD